MARARMRVWLFEQLGGPKSTAEACNLIPPNRRLLSRCVLDASLQLGGRGARDFEVFEGVHLDLWAM